MGSMIESDPKLTALFKWINERRDGHSAVSDIFMSPKIAVKTFEDIGRGFEAVDIVRKKELLIKISHSHLMNYNTVLRHLARFNKSINTQGLPYPGIHVPKTAADEYTDIYSRFSDEELRRLSSFQLVMMFLVLEKQRGSNSYWKPFIDVLPGMDSYILATFTWQLLEVPEYKKLVEYLPRSTASHTNRVLKRFTKDRQIVVELLAAKLGDEKSGIHSKFPLELFLWAWLCVNSRCLYMDLNMKRPESDNFTMAPVVDFINHSTEDECQLRIDVKGFHVFSGDKHYQAGEQVFLSYGPHSNDFLICEYGFVVPNNKWNDIDITDDILAFANKTHVQFLKDNDYYRHYTIDSTSRPSFRTEVALATVQEDHPETSRRLRAFLNGISDGKVYSRRSQLILSQILRKKINEFDAIFLEYSSDEDKDTRARKKAIGVLYRNMKTIAEKALEEIDSN